MNDLKRSCPELASLAISDELLAKYASAHHDREWSAGYLALWREAVEQVHELLPCEPVVNEHGQLVCPLNSVAVSVINNALMKNGVWSVDLADTNSGQREVLGAML